MQPPRHTKLVKHKRLATRLCLYPKHPAEYRPNNQYINVQVSKNTHASFYNAPQPYSGAHTSL